VVIGRQTFITQGREGIMEFMKRLSLIIILVAMVLYLPLNSYAGYYNGNDLVEKMREWEKANNNIPDVSWERSGIFVGFIVGVWDSTDDDYNPPGRVSVGQLCSIVAKYLKDNPEKWNLPASFLVRDAFQKAFPKK
jgi:hypothetical protein